MCSLVYHPILSQGASVYIYSVQTDFVCLWNMEVSHRQLQIPVQGVVSHPFMASWLWKGMGEIIQEARGGDKTTSSGTERVMDS